MYENGSNWAWSQAGVDPAFFVTSCSSLRSLWPMVSDRSLFLSIWRNVSRTFEDICMETPYWCTVNMAAGNQQKHLGRVLIGLWTTGPWSLLFLSFFTFFSLFTRELAYVSINISSNTWSGYMLKIKLKRRDFFNETAFLFWCHALWKLGSSNCCIFEMKHATEMENCTTIYFLFIFNLE